MRDFPKYLNSRGDYEYIRSNFPAEQWRPKWRELLDGRFAWRDVATLADGDAGVEDETHRVMDRVESPTLDAASIRIQQEFVEDENAAIFRLGFTVADVETALGESPLDIVTPVKMPETPMAPSSVPVYLLNASGTYHAAGCGYASASAESLTLAQIAEKNPKAKPCSRCGAPALTEQGAKE